MTAIGESVYNPEIVVDFTSLGNWIPGNVTVSYVHINALVWLLIAMYLPIIPTLVLISIRFFLIRDLYLQ
jgi:hypothetical protein